MSPREGDMAARVDVVRRLTVCTTKGLRLDQLLPQPHIMPPSLPRTIFRPLRAPSLPRRLLHRSYTAPPQLPSSPRLARYFPRLHALHLQTGVPLSSLAISFLILHELTALIPLVGCTSHSMPLGQAKVSSAGPELSATRILRVHHGSKRGMRRVEDGWRGLGDAMEY